MTRIRFRDEEPSVGSVVASLAVGALAGFAVGVVVAQKVGGISGLRARLRRGFVEYDEEREDFRHGHGSAYDDSGSDDELEDEIGAADMALEEDVLAAFQRDDVLRERAIDIGAVGDGVIELTGWVDSDAESRQASAVARSVPGVESVVNRLAVGDDADMDSDEMNAANEPREPSEEPGDLETNEPLDGGRWEGNRIGTGRRRQGTSEERDRHADPKAELEDKWLDEQHAVQEAAGDLGGIAERRRRGKKPPKADRTEGGPIAPGGVPKGDHVADPEAGRDVNPNL